MSYTDEEFDRPISVKRLAVHLPVTAEQLQDAGLPLPPGMQPPAPTPPLPRRVRWRLAWYEFVWSTRQRVGFWIAGHEPDEDGW